MKRQKQFHRNEIFKSAAQPRKTERKAGSVGCVHPVGWLCAWRGPVQPGASRLVPKRCCQ